MLIRLWDSATGNVILHASPLIGVGLKTCTGVHSHRHGFAFGGQSRQTCDLESEIDQLKEESTFAMGMLGRLPYLSVVLEKAMGL